MSQPTNLGVVGLSVREVDLDSDDIVNHMEISDDVPVRSDDYPGAGSLVRKVEEEPLIDRLDKDGDDSRLDARNKLSDRGQLQNSRWALVAVGGGSCLGLLRGWGNEGLAVGGTSVGRGVGVAAGASDENPHDNASSPPKDAKTALKPRPATHSPHQTRGPSF